MVDSYCSEIHMKGTDTTCFGAFYTTGPLLVQNNYLEAAGENIIFGGSGGNKNVGVPSDITIVGNTLNKPLTWVPKSTGSAPVYVVKNAFECKSCQRVLFGYNTITNVWAAGQLGYAIVLTVRSSQSGDFAVVNDITITTNLLMNVVSGVNTLAKDDQCGIAPYTGCKNAGSQDRWYIANNLMLFYDPKIAGGARNLMISLQPGLDRIASQQGILRDVVFQHNTAVSAASTPCSASIYFGTGLQSPPFNNLTYNIWLLDNSECRQPTGDWGLQGTSGLTQYMGSPGPVDKRYVGNVMYVPSIDKVQTFPPRNYSSTLKFTYVAPPTNYRLATPYWTNTTDGRVSGIY
jgi:hypothetical protein